MLFERTMIGEKNERRWLLKTIYQIYTSALVQYDESDPAWYY